METLKLEDFLNYRYLSGLELSPNGEFGAFVVKKARLSSNDYESDLWLLNCAENTVRPLTALHDAGRFFWLNETTVVFSGNRDAELKEKKKAGEAWSVYYAISILGGEAAEWLRLPMEVSDLRPLPGGNCILRAEYRAGRADIFTLPEEEKAKALKEQAEEKDYEVLEEIPYWENGGGFTSKKRGRLYFYDFAAGKARPFTSETEEALIADVKGDKVLYISQQFEGKLGFFNGLYEYDAATGETITLVAEKVLRINMAGYLENSIYIQATDMARYGLNQNLDWYRFQNGRLELWAQKDLSEGSSVGSDCRLGGGKGVRAFHDSLYITVTEGFSSAVYRLAPEGDLFPVITKEGSVDCFDAAGEALYFIGMRPGLLQEIYCCKDGQEACLTSFNLEALQNKYIGAPRHLPFEKDGWKLDGFVIEPADYDPSKKYPAILDIHGGPKTVYGTVFMHEMQVWANLGYFVFFCNPRGGDGGGDAFADIRGQYGTIDYEDLMVFTDEVLRRYPAIDPARLGVTGGSYGGFMTNWIIGHTNRFACAASQRSISNWISMAYTTDIGYYFAEDQTAATPWRDMEKMWEQSPLKYADKVTTPTLFIHSEQDYRCWLAEGLQMFTALKYHGVPARLCMFRGENHELSRSGKPKHRMRRLNEITAWFETYLK